MKKQLTTAFMALVLMVSLASCESETDFSNGKRQLENMGYTNIINTGHAYFCCGKGDDFSSGFIATDKEGRKVKGCICSGINKGVTVRFE